jgi:tRNA-binding protein
MEHPTVIDHSHFEAVEMRVGCVLAVRAFPEARKPAWQIQVDFGSAFGQKWTSAQVTNYSEDELVGRRVVGAINLGTRRIAGFESEFLLLGAVQPDGSVILLDVDPSAELGSLIA